MTDGVRDDLRRAGDVIRWATWPTIRTQTMAHHAWNVCRILTTIWPHAPAPVIVRALHHDSGELGAGDIPHPYKRDRPELKAIMDSLEDDSLALCGVVLPVVDDQWLVRLKLCDWIEMLEYAWDEHLLGSAFAWPVAQRMDELLDESLPGGRVEAYIRERRIWFRMMQTRRRAAL